jgi:hypothetical protein
MTNEFGPNQVSVDALLERLEKLDHGEALFLAGLATQAPERDPARRAMVEAAQRGGREREMRAAQAEVTRWVNTWFSGGFEVAGYGRDITPAQAAVDAAPVVLDAIGALVVGDLLSTDDYEALMGPWQELTGDHPTVSGTPDMS